ncbi:MAG: helix-hairpin-helix domain-containing protein [Bacilli bacterium]
MNSIDKSKENSLELLIFGLGIKGIGKTSAKLLCKNFNTMEKLINATIEKLVFIKDIGEVLAKNIVTYFNDKANLKFIKELKTLGVNMEYKGISITYNENVTGKSFVITGTFNLKREEIIEIMESMGARFTSNVSKKTNVVLIGSNAGLKKEKSEKLGIEIWTEEKLLKNLNL